MTKTEVDFSWNIGPNMSQNKVSSISTKLVALFNLLFTNPNSIEYAHEFGFDLKDYLFVTGEDEIENAKSEIKDKLTKICNKYIGENIITDIKFETIGETIGGGYATKIVVETIFGSLNLLTHGDTSGIKLNKALIDNNIFN